MTVNRFNPSAYVGVRTFGERLRMTREQIEHEQARASDDCAPSDALFRIARGAGFTWARASDLHPTHPARVEFERARDEMVARNVWIVRAARALRNG